MYDRCMRGLVVVLVLAFVACESGSGTHPPASAAVLNLNQATVADLEALPGIGEVRARSIIASRNARGGMFTTYEELLEIDGIGQTTLDQIRGYITLGPPHPRRSPRP